MRSTAETLLNGAKNDEQVVDQFLNSIISESDRLATLIDDIMEIAKLDSGVKHPEKAVSSVAETVRRAVSVLALEVERKQLDLTLKVPEELTGYFDPNQLLRAVRNLADNAVKYTPEGGTVEVGARKDNSNILMGQRHGIRQPTRGGRVLRGSTVWTRQGRAAWAAPVWACRL